MRKIIYSILSLCLIMSLAGCTATDEVTEETSETEETSSEETVVKTVSTGDELTKDETVYLFCNSEGTVTSNIVSDWIKNADEATSLEDVSELNDITVIKGDASFTQNGSDLKWTSDGGDIYYEGTTTKSAPLTANVTYYLDGKEVKASEIAHQSGKVKIRYEFKNNTTTQSTVNGKTEMLCVPFVVIQEMTLNGDHFKNVKVTNGKMVQNGDTNIVIGYVFPGLKNCLDLDSLDGGFLEDYFEIEADVYDFTLDPSLAIVTNEVFNKVDFSDISSIDDLYSSMNKLTSAMNEIIDGSGELYDNLNLLYSKSNELISGINQIQAGTSTLNSKTDTLPSQVETLNSGMSQLNGGLKTLNENSESLRSGAKQVFETLLATANTQIQSAGLDALGITVPTLTIDNYSETLTTLLSSLDTDGAYQTVYNAALAKVTAAVEANNDQIVAGVTSAVRENIKTNTVTPQVKASVTEQVTAAYRENVTSTINANKDAIVAQYKQTNNIPDSYELSDDQIAVILQSAIDTKMDSEDIKNQISTTVDARMETDEIKATIESYTDAAMETDDAKAAIESNVAAKKQELIDENMASDEVKAQIQEGLSELSSGAQQLASLKTSLDSYNTFYTGLTTYTEGVDSAYAGSSQLAAGTSQLVTGINTLKEGIRTLNAGAAELSSKASALPEGVMQLRDGSKTLKDGLVEFDNDGIEKISSAVNGDLKSAASTLKELKNLSEDYTNFTGISSKMAGSVKFVYKIAAVE